MFKVPEGSLIQECFYYVLLPLLCPVLGIYEKSPSVTTDIGINCIPRGTGVMFCCGEMLVLAKNIYK